MIFKSNWFVPKGFDAITIGPVIFVRPKFRDNKPLIAHEKVHVKQFWKSCGVFPFRYLADKNYRLDKEVEAYAVEARMYKNEEIREEKIKEFSKFLAKEYKVDKSKEEIEKMIRDKI